jgi:hypothetical protein
MGAGAVLGLGQAGLALNQANEQAKAQEAQGRYQQSMAEVNAMYADLQGKDAIRRGDAAATAIRKRGKQVIGAQRAALAAQGVVLDSGSALELQEETAELSAIDALTVKNNAWREAWGFKAETQAATAQGQMARFTSKANAQNTLITGGLQATNYGASGLANDGYFQRTRKS